MGKARRGMWGALVCCAACGGADPDAEVDTPVEAADEAVDFIQEVAWSPRGDRLVASWNQGDRFRLYGILAPGVDRPITGPTSGLQLSDGPDLSASWSRGGLWVVFGSTRDGQGEIYRMRPDGTDAQRLTDDPAEDGEPAYSPDGRSIAFVSNRTDGAPRIHVMDADGSNVRFIDSPPGLAHHAPEWAPDGRRIALQVDMGPEEGVFIYVTTPNGGWGRVRQGASPTWAPDSDHVYYERGDTIWSVLTSTSSRHMVVVGGSAPSLSPDGRFLAFVRGAWPKSSVIVHDLETGQERTLTR